MKQLFEYLISKENKNKITTYFDKSLLTPGDIVYIRGMDWMVFFTLEELKKIKNIKLLPYSKERMTETGGGFITYNDFVNDYNYVGLGSYDNKLKDNSCGFDVLEVYPGKVPFDEISEYTVENIEKEAKKRKRFKL